MSNRSSVQSPSLAIFPLTLIVSASPRLARADDGPPASTAAPSTEAASTWSPERGERAPPSASRTPSFALWVGPRLGLLTFGADFFENEPRRNQPSTFESTGNFVGTGASTQLDLGVRVARRLVPYFFYERGFLGQGHRFAATDASSSSQLYGVGLRFGGAERIGFVGDVGVARRVVSVSSAGETFRMSGLEVLKVALGAELRLSREVSLDALVSASGGSMSDSAGDVTYGPHLDGRTRPVFRYGTLARNSEAYVTVGVSVGAHFDLFGR